MTANHPSPLAISDVFTPVLAKRSRSFFPVDCVSVGVDRIRRNFELFGERFLRDAVSRSINLRTPCIYGMWVQVLGAPKPWTVAACSDWTDAIPDPRASMNCFEFQDSHFSRTS